MVNLINNTKFRNEDESEKFLEKINLSLKN